MREGLSEAWRARQGALFSAFRRVRALPARSEATLRGAGGAGGVRGWGARGGRRAKAIKRRRWALHGREARAVKAPHGAASQRGMRACYPGSSRGGGEGPGPRDAPQRVCLFSLRERRAAAIGFPPTASSGEHSTHQGAARQGTPPTREHGQSLGPPFQCKSGRVGGVQGCAGRAPRAHSARPPPAGAHSLSLFSLYFLTGDAGGPATGRPCHRSSAPAAARGRHRCGKVVGRGRSVSETTGRATAIRERRGASRALSLSHAPVREFAERALALRRGVGGGGVGHGVCVCFGCVLGVRPGGRPG